MRAAGDGGEGREALGLAFVAAVQTAASGRPGDGAIDGPVAAQPLGGVDAFAGQAGDAARAQPSAQVVVVVALVAVELGGAAPAGPAARVDRRMLRTRRCRAWLSCRLAEEVATLIGRPDLPVIK